MFKVVEYGPFGCQLDRGIVKSMKDIPEGYRIVKVESGEDVTIYIDPRMEKIVE
ncbi:hypothetical protein GF319_02650 [Candidatus Bathyarchaeota archaeon]|nr:hypothetical protein [Candidatus Bathyarchaeota archaeon]